HAVEVAPAREEDLALVRGEPRHGHVGAHRVAAARAEEVRVSGLVGRRVPGRDRALGQRQGAIRDDLLEVDADNAAEPLAGRARAERGVEREERGGGVAELARATGTVQAAAE